MVTPQRRLQDCTGFEWDSGNDTKNWDRHEVTQAECEEVFFMHPLLVHRDKRHSLPEPRCYALGRTIHHRLLFVVFTFRGDLIRVISARDMSPSEKERYLT